MKESTSQQQVQLSPEEKLAYLRAHPRKIKSGMVRGKSVGSVIADIIIVLLVGALALVAIIPMWHVLMSSFSDGRSIFYYSGIAFVPEGGFTFRAYEELFSFEDGLIWTGYMNTILYVIGTLAVGLVLNVLAGYCLSQAWTTTQLLTSGDEYISLSFGGAAEDAMAELRLWQDNSADVVVTRIKDYSYETVLSGTYTQNGDRTMTLTFGEESYTVSAPDENKLISVALTIPAGEYVTEAAEITLTGEVKEVGTPLFSFASGTVTFGTTGASPTPTMDGSLELVLYSDGIAEMNVTVSPAAGMEFTTVLDSGTYTVDESGTVPVYTFNFEKAGALTSSVAEGATETAATLELSYSVENASGTFDMGVPAVINFTVEDALLTYDWSAEAVYTFTATGIEVTAADPLPSQEGNTVDVTLSLWSDGTATLDLVLHTAGSGDFSAPASETGTWSATSDMIPTITVTMENAGTLTSAPDYSSATQTGIDLQLTYTAEGISYMTTMGIPVSLTFTGTLTGHYSIG